MANILLADIYEESAYFLRAMCRGRKHEAAIATRSQDAFDQLATGQFDGVIIDLTTPEAGNLAVLEAARELDPPVPIVVVTCEKYVAELDLDGDIELIVRPLKGTAIKQALVKIERHAELRAANRRDEERTYVQVPFVLMLSAGEIPCLSLNLSDGGAALIPTLDQRAFEEFESVLRRQTVRARMELPAGVIATAIEPDDEATEPEGEAENTPAEAAPEEPSELELHAKITAIRRARGSRVIHVSFDREHEQEAVRRAVASIRSIAESATARTRKAA